MGSLVVISMVPLLPSGKYSSTGKYCSSALSIISSQGCLLPRVESQFLAARSFGATFPTLAMREKDWAAFSCELASIQKTPQNLSNDVSHGAIPYPTVRTFLCCLTQIYSKTGSCQILDGHILQIFSALDLASLVMKPLNTASVCSGQCAGQ